MVEPTDDGTRDSDRLALEVRESGRLGAAERDELLRLFSASYREADPSYLDRSLATLRNVAVARERGRAVGFALAEVRRLDLPGLLGQAALLAGLACVDPALRRQGLFFRLTRLAASGDADADAEEEMVPGGSRLLLCGRTAHPAALRTLTRSPGAVPQPGRTPTPWQQRVGAAIASAYGTRAFDPRTFVCRGRGRPIGYPRIELEVEPAEWELFAPVDRSRGDALLGLSWVPDSPPDW